MVWPEMASTRSGLKWLDAISVPIKSPARAGGAGNGDLLRGLRASEAVSPKG